MSATRFKRLSMDEMTPEQRRIVARALAGPTKKIAPPLNMFLRAPELADPVERFGDYVRFKGAIPDRLKELIILLVARHWTAQYPWSQHYSRAIDSGIDASVVDQIAAGRDPTGLQAEDRVVYDFCATLLQGQSVGDVLFAAVVELYGEGGVADLIGLMSYYFLITMVHVVDRTPPLTHQTSLLKPLS